jgi:hypothetical protein
MRHVRSLGLAYARKTAEEAMTVLSEPDVEISTNWAIVFDNCDDPKIDISYFFPECDHGVIIVTTRNPQLGALSPYAHIPVGLMAPEEGIRVILKSALGEAPTSESDIGYASAIAKELEYLPVALVQAGSFIRRQKCLHTYLDKLNRNRANILKRKATGQRDRHYHCVYDTLEVTYPELTKHSQMFLGLLAFGASSEFPMTLVHRTAGNGFQFEPADLMDRGTDFAEAVQTLQQVFMPDMTWEEQFLDDLVEELEQYSLVTRMKVYNVPTLRMHSLVTAWAHDRLPEYEKDKYRSAMIRLLISGTGEEDQDLYEFLVPHLDKLSPTWGSLHANDRFALVKVLLHAGRINDSIPLAEHVFYEVIERYSQRTLRSIPAFLLLSETNWNTGDIPKMLEANSMDIETIDVLSELLFDSHPQVLRALAQRARGLYKAEYFEDAEAIQRGILQKLDLSTELHEDLALRVMEDLAATCASQQVGKHQEALDLSKNILDRRRQLNGPNHWRTLKAKQILGAMHVVPVWRNLELLGRVESSHDDSLKEMVKIYESLLEEKEEHRGPRHLDTLKVKQVLADAYLISGSRQGVSLMKEVIRARSEVQGSSHPDVISLKERLFVSIIMGRFLGEFQSIDQMFINQGGNGGIEAAQVTRARIKECDANDIFEGIQAMKEVVSTKKESLGPEHPETLQSMDKLATILMFNSQDEEAISLLNELVNVRRMLLGQDHKDTQGSLKQLEEAKTLWAKSQN